MAFPKRVELEVTFTDVSFELFRLLTGLSVLETIPTPQNRDAWRRSNLQKADS